MMKKIGVTVMQGGRRMIVDISLTSMKKMITSGSPLLRNETPLYIILYYANKTGVVYRTLIKKPKDKMRYLLLLGSLPETLPVWNVREFGGINE